MIPGAVFKSGHLRLTRDRKRKQARHGKHREIIAIAAKSLDPCLDRVAENFSDFSTVREVFTVGDPDFRLI